MDDFCPPPYQGGDRGGYLFLILGLVTYAIRKNLALELGNVGGRTVGGRRVFEPRFLPGH